MLTCNGRRLYDRCSTTKNSSINLKLVEEINKMIEEQITTQLKKKLTQLKMEIHHVQQVGNEFMEDLNLRCTMNYLRLLQDM